MTISTAKIDNSASAVVPDPSALRLRHILRTLPRECFQKNQFKAWMTALITVAMAAIGFLAIAYSPWYLLPIAWIYTGTAITGWFVVGHDCGHRSFANRRWVNDLVGHVMMAPLIYPFHSWRILHNYHHAHTNKLEVDNAWQPFTTEFYESIGTAKRQGYQAIRGWFWWVGSIAHWGLMHFDLSNFEPKDRDKVKLSIASVVIFAAIAFPALIITTGFWGFVKFWLMPWMVYHFWMSTFTLVHHTDAEIPFTPATQWNEAMAQLTGTVHCDYPRWVEFLCHDINVHVPHHISTAIPSYNLRMAHRILKENWGEYIQERQFSLGLMKEIVEHCHLYESDRYYQSFKEYRQTLPHS
ncbi:MAG: fatty acid desaturase [Oscillatoriophycideae cyanobacterium NC_groundwater_1537_Pr4_S-0.65um_50_18]|nr:fatty acid desaturase [Oscillatoriophycideae cyanobacterium NC_groundwater_1537_Pr4_S-0.65um_50_18]